VLFIFRSAALAAACVALTLAAPALAKSSGTPATGRIEKVTVHGASLEGNLEGDSADRAVFVYLPASYAKEKARRYPVVYNLHGYSLSAERWVGILGAPDAFDRTMAAMGKEMIVVSPDALTLHGGSMYSSSVATGDWERFIAKDLVAYIDGHYRTIPKRASRGLAGHSMGGYGTLRIGMKYPDVFSSIYVMSGCCLSARGIAPTDATLEAVRTTDEATKLGMGGRTTFAASAAWAADPKAPPFYLDLPTKGGAPQKDVLERYDANAPNVMMHQYVPAFRSFTAIGLEVGDKDGLLGDNTAMHQQLEAYGIKHAWETYDGDHVNHVPERFEKKTLPFFAEHLAFKP
jgi:enterochelin esterase-like enzyme